MAVKNAGTSGKTQPERLLTGVDAADRLGITPKWLRELAKLGVLPRDGRRYPWPAVREAYDAYKVAQRAGAADLTAARTALVRVQHALGEIELAKKRGEIVPIAEVADDYGLILRRVRGKLMNVPGKFAPRIRPKLTLAKARKALDEMVREIIVELRSDHVPEGSR